LLTETLDLLPFRGTKKAIESQNNYRQYMREFLRDKVDDVKTGHQNEGMDIMGQLVRTSYGQKSPNNKVQEAHRKSSKGVGLSDSDILGNAFIMIVAGHETTANTIHFTLAQLAANPATQRLLQRDVDAIFGQTEPHTWDYDASVNPILASMVGACINETLRLTPPVVDIPKKTTPNQDQVIVRAGQTFLLPRNMYTGVTAGAVHRNPRYWPTRPSKVIKGATDIDDWVPERWFRSREELVHDSTSDVEGADTEDFGGFAGPDTSAQLFRPVPGSFVPFSAGARSCLGRRIALAEMMGALSVIFQRYSLELAVDEWVSDEEVETLGREEKEKIYKKAQAKTRSMIEGATSILTLKVRGGNFIPIRLVPRGEEKFVSWMDS
jgi:cytochrome P450